MPTFAWPILPPPYSTKGQKFGATRGTKRHTGLDMGTAGQKVLASATGTVSASGGPGDARGNYVYLKHTDSYETRYLHLDRRLVSRGDSVATGKQIGVVGKTGLPKPWPHLHFEVLKSGSYIDPEKVLPPRSGGSDFLVLAMAAVGMLLILA